jgi:hypothetical protein
VKKLQIFDDREAFLMLSRELLGIIKARVGAQQRGSCGGERGWRLKACCMGCPACSLVLTPCYVNRHAM